MKVSFTFKPTKPTGPTNIPRPFPKPQQLNKRSFFTVINQAEIAYRETFGYNRARLEPGIRLNIPFIHSLYRVDMREQMIKIRELCPFTKDNVPVIVSGTVFYRVTSAEHVCFSVQDIKQSIEAVTTSAFRATVGKFDYDQVISQRNELSNAMLKVLQAQLSSWGVECTKLEIQDFGPKNEQVAHQLEKQVQAERDRRQNELNTLARIRTSEGVKQATILQSEADKQSKMNETDAKKYSIEVETAVMANQIQTLQEKTGGNVESIMSFLIAQKRLEYLKEMAKQPNKVYFLTGSEHNPVQSTNLLNQCLVTDVLSENKKTN